MQKDIDNFGSKQEFIYQNLSCKAFRDYNYKHWTGYVLIPNSLVNDEFNNLEAVSNRVINRGSDWNNGHYVWFSCDKYDDFSLSHYISKTLDETPIYDQTYKSYQWVEDLFIKIVDKIYELHDTQN